MKRLLAGLMFVSSATAWAADDDDDRQAAQVLKLEQKQLFLLEGTVKELDDDDLEIARQGLPDADLEVSSRTRGIDSIKKGDRVRVLFQLVDEDAVAVEVTARR